MRAGWRRLQHVDGLDGVCDVVVCEDDVAGRGMERRDLCKERGVMTRRGGTYVRGRDFETHLKTVRSVRVGDVAEGGGRTFGRGGRGGGGWRRGQEALLRHGSGLTGAGIPCVAGEDTVARG